MKGKANGKRFIAFLLSVAMILSTWAVAFAEESSPAESSVETQDTEVRSIQDGEAASEAGSVQNTEENQPAPEAGERQLACPLTVHQHTADCYNAEAALICGEADYAIHIHNDDCYDTEGNLVCPLPQVEAHEHTEACYEEQQTLVCGMAEEEGHIHDEACYTRTQGEIICTDESSEHIHSDECYAWGQELTCGMEENPGHQHGEACYGTQQVLICGKEEIIPHTHTEDCRDENGALICGRLQAAEHVHGEECFKTAANEIALTQTEGDGAVTLPDDNIAYPGKEQADGTWVAYDVAYSEPQPANATIKVTVTLPKGVKAPAGYKLFIRKVGASEPYYPKADAVKDEVSEYNDFQCFRIRWVTVDENGKSDVMTMDKVLGQQGNATIRIEYLGPSDGGKLKGPAGARKLLIYNSNENGTLKDTLADLVENVTVDGDFYTSFTFHTNGAGPYVFVSKKLELCYVDTLLIETMTDGSKPFDLSDTPGNDSSPNNRKVRSYDTIEYNLGAKFAARDKAVIADKVTVYFELILSKSATSARFDTSKMTWVEENYSIEYLDKNDNVIMVEAHNGKIYEPLKDGEGNIVRDGNGFAQADMEKEVYINSKVNGSGAGELSYKVATGTGIAKQRMVGWTKLSANEGQSILSGTQNFRTAIEVRNADNGEVFLPTFRMWLEGNEENYGPETLNPTDNTMHPATPHDGNRIVVESGSEYAVTVSAGTNFNLQLKKNGDMSYKSWFDFSTGKEVDEATQAKLDELAMIEENRGKANPADFVDANKQPLSKADKEKYENYRYGRITCYGVTLQLYNKTDNPAAQVTEKNMKGFSLPVGEISFDLNFKSNVTSGQNSFPGSDTEYTPILWEYNENVPANNSYKYTYKDPGVGLVATPSDGLGNSGRNLYWDYEERSSYAKGGAPSSFPSYHDGCYNGGNWQLKDGSGNPVTGDSINQVAGPTVVGGTGEDTSYHFSVSGYDFDFDNYYFPLRDAGNSSNVTGYDSYIRCFSAGCIQVLNVFPRVQKQSVVDNELTVKVSNLKLTTRAGQELKAEASDSDKIKHEVNKKDNSLRDKIDLYKPGGMTKGNAFNGLYEGREPNSTNEGFLGTNYWTTAYDCSAFAGDDIWIMSYGMRNSGGDYRTRAMNLLQLFDSRALSIRKEASANQETGKGNEPGEVSFLYAADPDYPEGYDTNKEGVLAYMNTVREEDLVYSTKMPDEDGCIQFGPEQTGKKLKCIGVLMEIRDCNLLGGKYQYMRIPVKVNGKDPELVGKTVATVNAVRVWSKAGDMSGITWANGKWNEAKRKNELEDYVDQNQADPGVTGYEGELANKGNLIYVKTEYENGTQKAGTHAGGVHAGNSLLILGYEANVNIGVDNKPDNVKISYNQAGGETTVNYRLRNIKTEVSAKTGQTTRPLTTLTVQAVLDRLNPRDKQRISVSEGTYYMNGIPIGNDPDKPIEITFEEGGETYSITVYAALDSTKQSVTFVIGKAPVGIQLPDITFDAQFSEVTALQENDAITTSVYISGEGDNRAYDKAKGNMDDITAYVVLGGGTNLTKSVDVEKIELGGAIKYTVQYTNSGTETLRKVYFYDLLPFKGDIRDSDFSGDVILRSFNVTSSESDGGFAKAQVYYSTIKYDELYNKVSVFGGTKDSTGNVTGMNEDAVEDMLAGEECEHNIKFFEPLGEVDKTGDFKYNTISGDLGTLMSQVRGVYVKAEELKGGQTITMTFTVQTKENEPGDWYRNVSNSWIAGSQLPPLTSNRVQTVAVGRRISGVVWYDKNLNGIRDDNEKLLDGVDVTLFKKDEKTEKYEICTEAVDTDATGTKLANPVDTTGEGAYAFDRLAAGDYIVAFSGDKLESYTGATVYQQNGKNDSDTSDGQVIDGSEWKTADGIDKTKYAYYIKYSVNSEAMYLHTIEEIRKNPNMLKDYVEDFRNQDLGLVISGPQMPDTGGPGTLAYIVGGMLLMIFAGSAWGITRRRKHSR